jgi:hypothetical protein
MSGQMRAGEQGARDAYTINAGNTRLVQDHLHRAQRGRRRPLAWLSLWRRRYLDGLIHGLQNEVARRRPRD